MNPYYQRFRFVSAKSPRELKAALVATEVDGMRVYGTISSQIVKVTAAPALPIALPRPVLSATIRRIDDGCVIEGVIRVSVWAVIVPPVMLAVYWLLKFSSEFLFLFLLMMVLWVVFAGTASAGLRGRLLEWMERSSATTKAEP